MKRGRPKKFDDTEALERAMGVFWRKGYDATSVDDLMEAMEIPRQSLYRTFTDKRTLFLRALDHYDEIALGLVVATLNAEGRAIDNIQAAFKLWNNAVSSRDRAGCLFANTYAQFLLEDQDVRERLMKSQKRIGTALEKALRLAQQQGDVDPALDAKAISRTIGAAVNGLLGLARAGLPAAHTNDILDTLFALITNRASSKFADS